MAILVIRTVLGKEDPFRWDLEEDTLEQLENNYSEWNKNADAAANGGTVISVEDGPSGDAEKTVIAALLKQQNKRKPDAEDIGWIGEIIFNVVDMLGMGGMAILYAMIEADWDLTYLRSSVLGDREDDAASTDAEEIVDHMLTQDDEVIPDWVRESLDFEDLLRKNGTARQTEFADEKWWVYLD